MAGGRWGEEREAAIAAARSAGQVLVDWAGRFSVRSKGKNDLVTEADHAAQETIRQALVRRFPSDGFLGEEGLDQGSDASRRWIIDPLDGTTNYVHGFPFFCVSMALESEGQLVVGVILDPIRKECFAAAAGGGAYLNSTSIQVSTTRQLGDSLVCVGLPADLTTDRHPVEAVLRVSMKSRSLRRMGSAALSLAYVAAGRLDGYWAHSINSWDAAAGVVLIREAGGQVGPLTGSEYNHHERSLVASNGLIQEELRREIAIQ